MAVDLFTLCGFKSNENVGIAVEIEIFIFSKSDVVGLILKNSNEWQVRIKAKRKMRLPLTDYKTILRHFSYVRPILAAFICVQTRFYRVRNILPV
jgi:hypothetical protein